MGFPYSGDGFFRYDPAELMTEVGTIAMNFHWGRNEIFGLKCRERKFWTEAIKKNLEDLESRAHRG